jgi:fructose-specific component phosphotransferase system IIB-like protein
MPKKALSVAVESFFNPKAVLSEALSKASGYLATRLASLIE